ncbi:MAG: S-methyl-5'-thioadenosine phosphorylase [Candidatus Aenigmatarchaeota archaeon]
MIGVIGGTGLYKLIDGEEREVNTEYGKPSDNILVGKIGNKEVAFLPRHGMNHDYPPHKVPYKANIAALKKLGVKRIIAPNAVGSLQKHIKPGSFVINDQFINFTHRTGTFYDGPKVMHVSSADPYCPDLRKIAIENVKKLGIDVHESGTVVVVEGPRFSSRAESNFFREQGWEIINMTQFPELMLAREMEMCYVNISMVTDYDTGVEGEGEAVSAEEVGKTFKANERKLKKLLFEMIPNIDEQKDCICSNALEGAEQ